MTIPLSSINERSKSRP